MLESINNSLQVTSLNTLAEYARGSIVELPPFSDGQPFVARIRRPSMLGLAKAGKIPNDLLVTANKLFASNAGFNVTNEKMLQQTFDVFDTICEACFVEPTYQQIKDAGIELTDDQYIFLFNYSQRGVKALKNFRTE